MEKLICVRLNDQDVAAKVIDGEAILINVANGAYYSMDKAGCLIWSLIQEDRPLPDIVEELVRRYDVNYETAEADVQRLAHELLAELLVLRSEDTAPPGQTSSSDGSHNEPYESPVLNIYRDVADLLALDPPSPALASHTWKAE